jgi:hypothetical protein
MNELLPVIIINRDKQFVRLHSNELVESTSPSILSLKKAFLLININTTYQYKIVKHDAGFVDELTKYNNPNCKDTNPNYIEQYLKDNTISWFTNNCSTL